MTALDPTAVVLVALIGSLALFVTDALRYDLVAVLVVLVLAIGGALEPREAYAGFASPAVVLVASMYVFAVAAGRTGVTEWIGRRLLGGGAGGETGLVIRVALVSGLLSGVLSNTAVVATLIPVCGTVGRRAGVPASRLLMPLAYGSLVGGLLSVVGTSKNVAVNGVLEGAGATPLALFEPAPLGIALLALTCLYFLWPGRTLLPPGRERETLSERYDVPKFVTEVLVDASSTMINRSVAESDLFERYGVSLLGLVRQEDEATVLAPGPYNRIRQEDVLILQGEPDSIVRMRRELGLGARPDVEVGEQRLASVDVRLLEAVVPAGSDLLGRTLQEADFRATTGLNVLALAKAGETEASKIARTPLEIGDTLLIQGHVRDVERVRKRRELIVLEEVDPPVIDRRTWTTIAILAGVLAAGALTAVHLSTAALAGAAALVALRIVRPDELRRGIDWSVLVLIGGMLALGRAFDRHGLGEDLALWMAGLGNAGLTPHAVLIALLAVTSLLTQLVGHVAAAVLMTPVALSLAAQMGVGERPLVMGVLAAASCSFLSPVAHQANAMVVGPGDYRYRDFLRAGTPLTLLLLGAAALLLPILFPFAGATPP